MSNNRNLIIGIVVGIIVVCICCPVAGGALYWLWYNGDSLVGTTGRLLPAVMAL